MERYDKFKSSAKALERYDATGSGGNNFDYIVANKFFNASGVDNFPLTVGDKDNKPYSNRIEQLQLALNKLGAKPSLVTDGKFGTLTKKALLSLGYPASVDNATWNSIINKSFQSVGDTSTITPSSGTSQVTDAELKMLWAKEFSTGKTKLRYDDWLRKEQNKGRFKQIANGIFSTLTEWLKQKNQLNNTNIPTDETTRTSDDESRLWGMPKPLAYGIIAVGSIGVIVGLIALGKKMAKATSIQTVPPVAG